MLLDSFIQLLFGYNIFGSKIASNNRLSSLFDDELIMGSYITRLLPIIMSITFILDYKKKFYQFYYFNNLSNFSISKC